MSAAKEAAIIAAINAQYATAKAVRPDQAAAQTGDHIIVFVSRRYVADQLSSGEVTIPGGRVVTRYVSKIVANVWHSQTKTRTALEDKILASDIGPFTFEAETSIDDDADGWYFAADSWTF